MKLRAEIMSHWLRPGEGSGGINANCTRIALLDDYGSLLLKTSEVVGHADVVPDPNIAVLQVIAEEHVIDDIDAHPDHVVLWSEPAPGADPKLEV